MSYDKPTESEAVFYNAILEDAVGQHPDDINALIRQYFDGDAIALTIGLASGEFQLRPSFVDQPGGDIRVEFGKMHEHEHFVIIHPTIPEATLITAAIDSLTTEGTTTDA